MRASGAEYRRTNRDVLVERVAVGFLTEEKLRKEFLRELSAERENILSVDVKSECLAVTLDDRIKFLDNIDRLILRREVLYELFGKRVDKSELKIRRGVAEGFERLVVRRTRGDDSDLRALVFHNFVERTVLGELAQHREPLFDLNVARTRVAGHHNVL